MRSDGKNTLGGVLRVPKHERQRIQRVESPDAWLFTKPSSDLDPKMFSKMALEPLLRQAVVMIATSVETYVGDRVTELLTVAGGPESAAAAQEQLARVVGGLASCEPSKVNSTFALVGLHDVLKAIMPIAGLETKPTTVLAAINSRRNRIAHRADWLPVGGRSPIDALTVLRWINDTEAVVAAIDRHTERRRPDHG
jgi:hypothetical protein